ncbi:MAG: ATP-binding protein [Bacteroidota bacterium]
MTKHQTLFQWSGGKDSMLALHYLQSDPYHQIRKLLTNFSASTKTVSMHGVQEALITRQAEALGLALDKMYHESTDYEQNLDAELENAFKDGFTSVAYGDIFLEDLREYKDRQLACHQLTGIYPLWKKDTKMLVNDFIDLGYQSVIVCVNGSLLDKSFVGKTIDKDFLNSLPKTVDPCGENGEFHSFVYDGPLFKIPVSFNLANISSKSYPKPMGAAGEEVLFWYGDLVEI